MEAVGAAVFYLRMVGQEKLQRVMDGREGDVFPRNVFRRKQFDFQAFDSGFVIQVEQGGAVKHMHLVHMRYIQ